MKRFNYLGIIIVFVSLICLTNNCKKDSPSPDRTNLPINQFIWSGLNFFYYWSDSVPKLTYAYYQNDTNKINAFLNGYTDHEKLFYDLLYKYNVVDKW